MLFVALFAWIALSFISSLAGFMLTIAQGKERLGLSNDGPLPQVSSRTALLMPTYNEDPGRLLAGLQAIYESVAATGQLEHFDFFVLSDTTRPQVMEAEEAAFAALRERLSDTQQLFYRRRTTNAERKAGNIAEWVRRFGAAYPHMLVLDADSLMSGETIVRLVRMMQAHPQIGAALADNSTFVAHPWRRLRNTFLSMRRMFGTEPAVREREAGL